MMNSTLGRFPRCAPLAFDASAAAVRPSPAVAATAATPVVNCLRDSPDLSMAAPYVLDVTSECQASNPRLMTAR